MRGYFEFVDFKKNQILFVVRPEIPRVAAKSSLRPVTSEPDGLQDPPVKEPGGAHTSQGCVGGGQRPPSELGIVFLLASMPVSWSNFGISAGSHPEREFTGQPPMARECDSSSTSPVLFRLGNSNTRLWVGRTQQPQLCSRCACVSDVLRRPGWLCQRLGLFFLSCSRYFSLFRATARQDELCPF